MPAARVAEAVAVPEHPGPRRGRVDAERVQAEPAVGHPGVDPCRGAELLLRLRIGAHRVGVHASYQARSAGASGPCVPKSVTSPTHRAPVGCRLAGAPSAAVVEPPCRGPELQRCGGGRSNAAPRDIVPRGWTGPAGCRRAGSTRWKQAGRLGVTEGGRCSRLFQSTRMRSPGRTKPPVTGENRGLRVLRRLQSRTFGT